ncbi:MAG: hypothetical protein HY861_04020 [Chlamydiia bacterium]|nr:hypothetical protein [Chlamydiia bacterium]
MNKGKTALLGDHPIGKRQFSGLDGLFASLRERSLGEREMREWLNQTLLQLIQKEAEPCFLLPAVLGFIERVAAEKLLEHYTFTHFELWLNQHAHLHFEENYRMRAKIAGKWLERSDYQALFPIGMGKIYEGTHFVTAHKSPDLDTTVASFWGWLDAFAARVGDGLHIWNVPGGPPQSQIEIQWMFQDVFGATVFTHLAKTRTALHLTGHDLMGQQGVVRVLPSDDLASVDHERDHKAVIVVGSEGDYLGDWRNVDVEGCGQVVILLSSCLRWFENRLHLQLISLFAEPSLRLEAIAPKLGALYEMKLQDSEPASEFRAKQKEQVEGLLSRVIGIPEGLACTFERVCKQLSHLAGVGFEDLTHMLQGIKPLFDGSGRLKEERPCIFRFLEKTVSTLHETIFTIRQRLEKFDIALKIKTDVFGHHPTSVTLRSEVEEIRSKIGSYLSLTVIDVDGGRPFPVGVIQAANLHKTSLGTVSLRDFCNRDEMTIPPYLDVISVIDHHKSQLATLAPPMALIADVQSCNTLVAIQAFALNDRYSLAGQTLASIEAQIQELQPQNTPTAHRLLQRLFNRRKAAQTERSFYVHPEREMLEYLHFLYAILDDTDLLTKVSAADVECVARLLNLLKSLSLCKEAEVLTLDDLPRDPTFPKQAAKRILQNEEMYSLYRKIYTYREKEIADNLGLCAQGKPSSIFSDTKEQNGCCRIGQTKIFAQNVPLFLDHADAIRKVWLNNALRIYREKPEIDLHLHMISTVVSAEEVYRGSSTAYPHQDELWIWAPQEEVAIEHLKTFLSAFQSSPGLKNNPVEVDFLGDNAAALSLLFQESFLEAPHHIVKKGLPLAMIRYAAGSLNSRKAMISPFLPTKA